MRLVVRPKTIQECQRFDELSVDIFCLDTAFTTKRISHFDIDSIKHLAKIYPLRIYLLINQMVHQKDIKHMQRFLEEIKTIDVAGIIIFDLTVFVLAQSLGLANRIIYQPGTMNTDRFSEFYFARKAIKGITLSREITIAEIKTFQQHEIELSLIGHGYLDMFYSKRKLLSNYAKHKGLQGFDLVNNHQLRLNEEIRENDFYPILEDEFGTHIFRSKKLISIQHKDVLSDLLSDLFLERLFIEDEEYFDSIALYQGRLTEEEFLTKYQNYDSGFYHRPTEKVKGERDEN